PGRGRRHESGCVAPATWRSDGTERVVVSWVAEILRKEHRVCSRCRMGPTHLYEPASGDPLPEDRSENDPSAGTPPCNACLEIRMTQAAASFAGRCLLFEPALGPDALAFSPLAPESATPWPAEHREAARSWLQRMQDRCVGCGGDGRFLWVPVEPDAN